MQYTSNYNLGLVEGTDLVNPMTQMNPNFTDLDTIIKGVSDNTITTATEVTVGTVHGLTRTNTDANVFKWVATANYNVGDTFTVDGVTVTALKTNGTVLQTGEYIIGAAVLGILDGTRLTVFVAQNISQTATDISYDNTVSGLSATNVQNAIDEVNSDLTSNTTINNLVVTLSNKCGTGSVIIGRRIGKIVILSCYLNITSNCARLDKLADIGLPTNFSGNYFTTFSTPSDNSTASKNYNVALRDSTMELQADQNITSGQLILGQIVGLIS